MAICFSRTKRAETCNKKNSLKDELRLLNEYKLSCTLLSQLCIRYSKIAILICNNQFWLAERFYYFYLTIYWSTIKCFLRNGWSFSWHVFVSWYDTRIKTLRSNKISWFGFDKRSIFNNLIIFVINAVLGFGDILFWSLQQLLI